jgi:hypothetical protein
LSISARKECASPELSREKAETPFAECSPQHIRVARCLNTRAYPASKCDVKIFPFFYDFTPFWIWVFLIFRAQLSRRSQSREPKHCKGVRRMSDLEDVELLEEAHVEERVAKLETHVGHIQADIGEIKRDLREIRGDITEIRKDISDLSTGLKTGLSDQRSEMHQGFADLRSEMHQGYADLRIEMLQGFASLRMSDIMTRIWMLMSLAAVLGVMARGFKWI